jgi:hypothetical protein
MPFLRSDQALILVSVAGVNLPNSVSWQSFTGGDVEASSKQATPGGVMPSVSLGGVPKRTQITVTHVYGASYSGRDTHSVDHYVYDLDNVCGFALMTVSTTPLDDDTNPCGDTMTYTGTLIKVQRPAWDVESATVAKLSLVLDPNMQGSRTSSS